MISEAKRLANGRNAKKSKGPVTEEGKKRSAMNALTHGLTARIAILPDEDPQAFKQRMVEWNEVLKPRNDVELYHAKSAVYFSWQLDRARRATTAKLVVKAHTVANDQQEKEEKWVDELAAQLFPSLTAAQTGGTQHGSEGGQAVDPPVNAVVDCLHPRRIIRRLQAFSAGCRWLEDRWNYLGALLENGLAWEAPERLQAVRLLGVPAYQLGSPELMSILRACHVLDPEAGDLVSELSLGRITAQAYRAQGRPAQPSSPADQAAARQELLAIVRREKDRLEAVAENLRERDELLVGLEPHQLAFHESAEGQKMMRYEAACNRSMLRAIDEVYKRQGTEELNRYAPKYNPYQSTRSAWFSSADEQTDSSETTDLFDTIDSICMSDDDDTAEVNDPTLRNEPTEEGGRLKDEGGVDANRGTPPLRNERTEPSAGAGEGNSQSVGKSDVTPKMQNEPVAAARQVLRNEPTAASFEGPHIGIARPAIKGGSRKARRARAAQERANGVRGLDSALNLDGLRPRKLLGAVPGC